MTRSYERALNSFITCEVLCIVIKKLRKIASLYWTVESNPHLKNIETLGSVIAERILNFNIRSGYSVEVKWRT